ncbi:MAG TPA: RNA polymerase sigma factor [Solirubrobacterales bacterium]
MSPPPAENFAARIFLGPALRAQPDRRLVDLVRNGYDAAFEEIVRRYRRPLDRFAAAIVGGRSEDVTQDAFSKALLALRGTDQEIELRPWLYRIVRNTALNDLRDQAPPTAELNEALPGGPSAAAEAEAHEELADLMKRLQALPEPQRAALVMRELEGLSHEEIAAALGVSGGAARQAIYRARATLRNGLGLLVPLPVLRLLADHGGEVAAGGALAAGASTAGGAALGGLGGGAVKAGVATILVAGAVGAGVAVDHRQGDRPGPDPAVAAPLTEPATVESTSGGGGEASAKDSSGGGGGELEPGDDHDGRDDDRGDDDRGQGSDEDSDDDDRSGFNRSEQRSGHSGSDDRSGSGSNSGPGSLSSDRHSGSDDGGDDHSGHGSGGGDDDRSGSSGSGSSGSGSDSSGPGSGELEAPDPVESDDDNSGSGSSSSGSGSSGSGSSGSSDSDDEPDED